MRPLILAAFLLPLLAACADKGAAPLVSGPVRPLNPSKWTASVNDLRVVEASR